MSKYPSEKKKTKVIAITGGKGGVGKTTVAVNLGVAIAKSGLHCMLLDADFGLANVDVMLGKKPLYNLSHVAEGLCDLSEVILTGPQGLEIIPASNGQTKMANIELAEVKGLIDLISNYPKQPDVLLIDTSAGISDGVMGLAAAADEIIVVVCNEPSSITDAYAVIKLLNHQYRRHQFGVLSNMIKGKEESEEVFAKLTKVADRFLDVSLKHIGAIPHDPTLLKAVRKQKSVVDAYPTAKSSAALVELANKIRQWPTRNRFEGGLRFYMQEWVLNNTNEVAG